MIETARTTCHFTFSKEERKRLTLWGVSQPDHNRYFAQRLVPKSNTLYTWYRNGTVTRNDEILRVDDWGYNWREMAFLIIQLEGLDAYPLPVYPLKEKPLLPHEKPPPLRHSTRLYQGQDCLWYILTLAHAEHEGHVIWRGSWLSIHHTEHAAHSHYEADHKRHLNELEMQFAYWFKDYETKLNPPEYPERIKDICHDTT